MTSPSVEDELFSAADQKLIEEFLDEEPQWQHWTGDAWTLLDIGDLETHWALAIRKGRSTFETISGGHRHVTADFGHPRDARRFMIMKLGDSRRRSRGMHDINPAEPASGVTVTQVGTGFRLSWTGGEANFRSDTDLVLFSWVATAPPADIAASFRHINGEPLFDLGIRFETRQQPPLRGVMDSEPVESDPALQADLAIIDDFLAESLLWSRRPSWDPIILDVADFDAEWVLRRDEGGYLFERRSQGGRTASGTFSSARGARRFAVMELGRLWRESRPVRSIWHRVPAPGTQVHSVPAGHRLTWEGGEAVFAMDYSAINFSWIAAAELADIAASYRDPNGEPLFDLDAG